MQDDLNDAHTRMYLFQFPEPFPTFIRPAPAEEPKPESPRGKRVTFAEDVKEGKEEKYSSSHVKKDKEAPGPLEGIIGQLDILASGAVRMRLGNDMVFDVSWSGPSHCRNLNFSQ
jgi:DNA-directed RNA polymerase III subunit RPC4